MTDTQQSWNQTLQVWIARFRDAQARVRELQDELDAVKAAATALTARYADALDRLTDEALEEHYAAVQTPSEAPRQSLPVVAPDDAPCGSDCGCR